MKSKTKIFIILMLLIVVALFLSVWINNSVGDNYKKIMSISATINKARADYNEISPNGLGDINDDGIVNDEDAILIQQYISKLATLTDEQKLRSDIDKDGEIIIKDVTLLQKYIDSQNPYNEIAPNGLGDINNDGILNDEDATLIQQYISKLATLTDDQKLRADIDKDGEITIKDVTLLKSKIGILDEEEKENSDTQNNNNSNLNNTNSEQNNSDSNLNKTNTKNDTLSNKILPAAGSAGAIVQITIILGILIAIAFFFKYKKYID